jgi:hypothetical protein
MKGERRERYKHLIGKGKGKGNLNIGVVEGS